MMRSKITFVLTTGVTLYCWLIILCLTALFFLGFLMFILACIPILCALPVLYMGSKLVDHCMHYLRVTVSEIKARKS